MLLPGAKSLLLFINQRALVTVHAMVAPYVSGDKQANVVEVMIFFLPFVH